MIWLLLAGCGTLFGPPVTCKSHMPREEWATLENRDLVCHVDEPIPEYWVTIEYEDSTWGPRSSHYGHHEVRVGDLSHHDDAVVGARVTIEADGYWPRRFTIPFTPQPDGRTPD